MRNAEKRRMLTTLLFGVTLFQSCVGAGDMFADKRKVAGDYFLMTDEGDQQSYYLFRKGRSGSLTGRFQAIGWDQHFILIEDDGTPGHWAAFPINPEHDPFAQAATRREHLVPGLKQTIVLRSEGHLVKCGNIPPSSAHGYAVHFPDRALDPSQQ